MGLFGNVMGSMRVIGVDIGSHTMKAVEIGRMQHALVLREVGIAPTPPDAVQGGMVLKPEAVGETLTQMLRAMGTSASDAVAAVAGPTVVVRRVELPAMSDKQLRSSIQWEARNYISFPVEDSIVEFQILEHGPEAARGQMEVMLVATPREMVESRVRALEFAGLEPVAVEIEPLAMTRALVDLNPSPALGEETVALVDMGAAYTDVTIVHNRQFVLSRVIPIAGNNLTEAIKSALEISLPEAATLKETSMRVVVSEEERATLDPQVQQASRAVEPLLEELVREIRRSLAYYDYQQQMPGEPGRAGIGVHRIMLSGGSARLTNLPKYLETQLGIPVEMPNVFEEYGMVAQGVNPDDLRRYYSSLVVGAGLALRESQAAQPQSSGKRGTA
jgi:type IV pilus assembly protein PilM